VETDLIRLYRMLAATGLPCMIGGGFATILLGEPRSTLDIDIALACVPTDAERICAAFPGDRFYVPPVEVVRREIARGARGSFNIIDSITSYKADIYPAGDDELIAYGLAHSQEMATGHGDVRVAPVTYVIAIKLRYFAISHQDKHLRDIRALLHLHAGGFDPAVVERWASIAGVEEAWRACQQRVGEA
jgi:hypothetical protein